jgi:serine/threonine protein kinase
MPTESTKKKVCATCQKEYAADSQLSFCPEDNTPLFLASSDLAGTTVGDSYKVETLCGYDNCLTHYYVRHASVGERFVLKVFPVTLGADEKVARFNLQAQALSKVTHPGFVRLLDYGVLPDSRAFIICENVEGSRLSQILEGGCLPPARAVDLIAQVCDAIGHAHDAGFVHSGLKPSAVLVCSSANGKEQVKVADLGVARFLLQDKHAMNALESIPNAAAYASPEQCLDKVVDARTDVYAIGCMLYEALSGRRPYEGRSDTDVITKHASAIMPLPFAAVRKDLKLPNVLENIVFKALAKEPGDRYQNAHDLKAALEQARASVEAPHVVAAFSDLLSQRREGLRREQTLGRVGKLVLFGLVIIAILIMLQALWQHLGG